MESFWVSFNAVAPLLLLVALGFYLNQKGLLAGEVLSTINYLCFHLFLPFLLYANIIHNDVKKLLNPRLFFFVGGMVLFIFIITSLFIPLVEKDSGSRGALIQSLFRSNYVILGVPLSYAIYGEQGSAIASMLIALVIPMYNVLAVIILAIYGTQNDDEKKENILIKIAKNPLIKGCFFGILTLLLPFEIPKFLDTTVSNIAKIGSVLPIILLGSALNLKGMKKNVLKLSLAVFGKLIIIPAIAIPISILFGFRGAELTVILTVFATPPSVSSGIMAEQMNCNGELASEIIVLASIFSFLSIFLWVFFLSYYQLL